MFVIDEITRGKLSHGVFDCFPLEKPVYGKISDIAFDSNV